MIGPQQRLGTRTLRVLHDRLDAKVTGINERWQMAAAGGANAVVLQASSDALSVAAKARTAQQGVDTARAEVPPAAERTRERWQRGQREREPAGSVSHRG